eukprot:gnl/Chilomastix_cuspidata/6365.p1 GENE.gnl/Chilomastix_cuspidata/6365~~gnl/Chilomastix_cuspidata/6365.p1  ORF type:complete len:618 (+),score=64.59 gnl/Chilomastix_cuspidata/6365:3-1856(+)
MAAPGSGPRAMRLRLAVSALTALLALRLFNLLEPNHHSISSDQSESVWLPNQTISGKSFLSENVIEPIDVVLVVYDPILSSEFTQIENLHATSRQPDTLRYVLRSIAQFMPWVHRVFIISNGAAPTWLRSNSTCVTFLSFNALFDSPPLPRDLTENVVLANIHQFPDISRRFVVLDSATVLLEYIPLRHLFHPHTGVQLPTVDTAPGFSKDCATALSAARADTALSEEMLACLEASVSEAQAGDPDSRHARESLFYTAFALAASVNLPTNKASLNFPSRAPVLFDGVVSRDLWVLLRASPFGFFFEGARGTSSLDMRYAHQLLTVAANNALPSFEYALAQVPRAALEQLLAFAPLSGDGLEAMAQRADPARSAAMGSDVCDMVELFGQYFDGFDFDVLALALDSVPHSTKVPSARDYEDLTALVWGELEWGAVLTVARTFSQGCFFGLTREELARTPYGRVLIPGTLLNTLFIARAERLARELQEPCTAAESERAAAQASLSGEFIEKILSDALPRRRGVVDPFLAFTDCAPVLYHLVQTQCAPVFPVEFWHPTADPNLDLSLQNSLETIPSLTELRKKGFHSVTLPAYTHGAQFEGELSNFLPLPSLFEYSDPHAP